jgi:uncharacterized protein YdeI (YjbR/CyaY-like superfamily)
MPRKQATAGYMHKVPADIRKVLASNKEILEKWNALTPLARNEWICWVTIVKNIETKKEHITRLQADLLKGMKRPCCWPGCPHRNPKAKKWFKND